MKYLKDTILVLVWLTAWLIWWFIARILYIAIPVAYEERNRDKIIQTPQYTWYAKTYHEQVINQLSWVINK